MGRPPTHALSDEVAARRSLFDALASRYDEHFDAPLRRLYDALAWERIAPLAPQAPATIVDAGCGVGRWAERFLAAGHEVVGIEDAPAMAAEAHKRCAGARFRLVQERIEDAEIDEASAALVVAMGSLQYTDDPGQVIARMARWVRPGGTVCVLVDSLVALVLELLERGDADQALERLTGRRGVWRQDHLSASLRLLDRRTLEEAFQTAGLVSVRSAGLLVSVSALGRRRATAWAERDPAAVMRLERRLGEEPLMADAGKQLLVLGRRPA